MSDMIGMRVGRYTLDEQIGKGGMARVFRAHETTSPDVVIALKVGHNTFSRSDQYERRFAREIEMIVRLDHPNIVPIITFGQDNDLLYMAMPHIPGGTLGHRVDEGLLFTPQQAAQMTEQIGSALDYAHSLGMIHRDVKPENIMILGENAYALADFGLAKLPMTSSTDITAEGSVLGSPPYMSPEQINGDLVDGRADVLCVGNHTVSHFARHLPVPGATLAIRDSGTSLRPATPPQYDQRGLPHSSRTCVTQSSGEESRLATSVSRRICACATGSSVRYWAGC